MQDPDKEKFILKAIEKIKYLRQRVIEARKNNENMADVMKEIQKEVNAIKKESEHIFDSQSKQMSPEELEAYLQNPSNFSNEDWDLLETIKKETDLCKKEIIKSNEKEAVEDLINKKKGKHGLKKKSWNAHKKFI